MRQIRYWGSYIGMTCGLTLLSSLLMTALSLLRGGMAELALAGNRDVLYTVSVFCRTVLYVIFAPFLFSGVCIGDTCHGVYEKTVPARGTGSGADRGSGAGRRECTVGATW